MGAVDAYVQVFRTFFFARFTCFLAFFSRFLAFAFAFPPAAFRTFFFALLTFFFAFSSFFFAFRQAASSPPVPPPEFSESTARPEVSGKSPPSPPMNFTSRPFPFSPVRLIPAPSRKPLTGVDA